MAARDLEMDAWINRYRSLAEGVVIMVCPVLLAIALNKVNLKIEEHGRVVPIIMLVVAAITLIAGICPFLICRLTGPPHTVTKCMASLSCTCLVVLACWIMRLIISDNWLYPAIGAVFGLCIVVSTVIYGRRNNAAPGNAGHYNIQENSLELSAGVTALLFLGLEGLALEGQNNVLKSTPDPLSKPMGASFIACVVGVWLMLLETNPAQISHDKISNLTKLFDIIMTSGICLVMFFIIDALMKIKALLLMAPPFLILMVHVFHLVFPPTVVNANNGREFKPASLELTKVTFTGFLAVSIPRIRNGSLNKCTHWFILLAASAIASGLVWRLFTHVRPVDNKVVATANIASFCTHLCIVIAAIPFAVMAGNALS
ncbi:uncharacterized protein LOC133900969 [Phragmites australis]|uniref:uncharacterized protein LOC133900969 n=1 Tax=Phragmites australis TaxID=29695 RepID=UPI002D789305|nr:uncharacterized protein LOC133900969 [Phragmites australis]